MPTTIKFNISQDGTVTETVEGVKGQVCESLTKTIEEKLGEVESRVHTGDYYNNNINYQEEFTHDSECA